MRLRSARALEVARLVTEDLSDRQIAQRLGIAETTVKSHVHHILRALRCNSRVGIAVWYVRHHKN